MIISQVRLFSLIESPEGSQDSYFKYVGDRGLVNEVHKWPILSVVGAGWAVDFVRRRTGRRF